MSTPFRVLTLYGNMMATNMRANAHALDELAKAVGTALNEKRADVAVTIRGRSASAAARVYAPLPHCPDGLYKSFLADIMQHISDANGNPVLVCAEYTEPDSTPERRVSVQIYRAWFDDCLDDADPETPLF